jgi:hypothetical protein
MEKFDVFYEKLEAEDPLSTNMIDIFLEYKSEGGSDLDDSIDDKE